MKALNYQLSTKIMIAMAIALAIASLYTSGLLVRDLQQQERQRMELWAEAMRALNEADEDTDLSLVLDVINKNNTIPVVVLDQEGELVTSRNINKSFRSPQDSISYLKTRASEMQEQHRCIEIQPYAIVCYDESLLLKRLAIYPYIQLSVVALFVVVAIFALFSSLKAEQNKVWVGLSKETAHQLGTPISSLLGWQTILKELYPNESMLGEMEQDVRRLERIADRFSKIGSRPNLKPDDLNELVLRVVSYMNKRISSKIIINVSLPNEPTIVNLEASLFEWVLENLCKNAVDAIVNQGTILIAIRQEANKTIIDVSDTGKGMSRAMYKDVFKPGFTTKQRGWGLGLSLCRRIIEQYHKGKIFVKHSEQDKGTTFTIELFSLGIHS